MANPTKMTRSELRSKCHVSDELATEIEAYYQWKCAHLNETPTNFQRVTSSLPLDTDIEWTPVQLYLLVLSQAEHGSIPAAGIKQAMVAFPGCANYRRKLLCLKYECCKLYNVFLFAYNTAFFNCTITDKYFSITIIVFLCCYYIYVIDPKYGPMPATTPAHAPLNKPHEPVAPVVAMATEPIIVLDDEEGVAPEQHATIDAHANLSSSM